MKPNIKSLICGLFDVQPDEKGVQRVVTPMEYIGTNDKVVIRIRPLSGGGFKVDDSGDAMFYAGMAGADVEADTMQNWLSELPNAFKVNVTDEVLSIETYDEAEVAINVMKVAQVAQEFFSVAVTRTRSNRSAEYFKNKVREAVYEACAKQHVPVRSDVELDDISGNFVADHVVQTPTGKVIVIAATGVQRLLEAALVQSTYEREHISAKVIAAVESQESVGKKQFERAAYYIDKTVTFSPHDFSGLIARNIQ